MEYITQKFILNKGNKINIRLDNPLELPGNEWYCGLKEFSLEPRWSLADDEITVNYNDGTSTIIKPVHSHAAANIDTVLEEMFTKRRVKRSKDVLGDITGVTKKKAKAAEEEKKQEEEKKAEEEKKREEEKKQKLEEDKKREEERKRKLEEDKKLEEERKQKLEDERKQKLEEEKKRQKLENDKKLEEEKKRENERKQKMERDKKLENDKKLEEERKQKLENDKKLDADKKLEEERKREKERKQKLENDKKLEDERKRKLEEENKREEERKRLEEEKRQKLVNDKKLEEERKQKLENDKKLEEEKKRKLENPVDVGKDFELKDDTLTIDYDKGHFPEVKMGHAEKLVDAKPKKPDIVADLTGTSARQVAAETPVAEAMTMGPGTIKKYKHGKKIPPVPDTSQLENVFDSFKKQEEEDETVIAAPVAVPKPGGRYLPAIPKLAEITPFKEESEDSDSEVDIDGPEIPVSEKKPTIISKEKLNENQLEGIKSIKFTTVYNKYTVTFDTNYVNSIKLSHGFAPAIGFTNNTTVFNNQVANDFPSVNHFYSHVCIRMHGILRPLNKNRDAEIAVIPVANGKNVYSFSSEPLYFKVEKTLIDTISLEFTDFLDNPIVCDNARGYFVLQFVKNR